VIHVIQILTTLVGKSDAGRIIDTFDKTKNSEILFNFLKIHPVCRELFQEMVRSDGFLPAEKAFFLIKTEAKEHKNSFVKEQMCGKCGHLNEKFDLAQYDFEPAKIPSLRRACINCGHALKAGGFVNSKEIEPWNVTNLFIYGSKIGLFDPAQYLICPWCYQFEEYLTKNIRNTPRICKQCKQPLEMRIDFQLNPDLKSLVRNKSGVWLEWYVWKLLSKSLKPAVEHNRIWKIDGMTVEIDVEIDSIKQPTAILCDTKKDPTFNIENFHLLAKKFKRLALVTTKKKVDEKIVDAAKSSFSGNIILIKGPSIEDLTPNLMRFK